MPLAATEAHAKVQPPAHSTDRPLPSLSSRGYECKEPEPGKLTLAFRHLEDALQWGCALQQELLGFSWPESGAWGRAAGRGLFAACLEQAVILDVSAAQLATTWGRCQLTGCDPPHRLQCWSGTSVVRCGRRRAPTCCGAACVSRWVGERQLVRAEGHTTASRCMQHTLPQPR